MHLGTQARGRLPWLQSGTATPLRDCTWLVLQSLYQMELRGEWNGESVSCSEGEYAVGDYWSWKGWRDGLAGVQALGDVGR